MKLITAIAPRLLQAESCSYLGSCSFSSFPYNKKSHRHQLLTRTHIAAAATTTPAAAIATTRFFGSNRDNFEDIIKQQLRTTKKLKSIQDIESKALLFIGKLFSSSPSRKAFFHQSVIMSGDLLTDLKRSLVRGFSWSLAGFTGSFCFMIRYMECVLFVVLCWLLLQPVIWFCRRMFSSGGMTGNTVDLS